MSDYEYEVVVE